MDLVVAFVMPMSLPMSLHFVDEQEFLYYEDKFDVLCSADRGGI